METLTLAKGKHEVSLGVGHPNCHLIWLKNTIFLGKRRETADAFLGNYVKNAVQGDRTCAEQHRSRRGGGRGFWGRSLLTLQDTGGFRH